MYSNPYNLNYPGYPPRQPNGIIWVQGIEGAKAFQLTPDSNAVLLDSENEGKMYIKTCDRIGMCQLRCFNFAEIKEDTPPPGNYITREEFDSTIAKLLEKRSNRNEQLISTVKSNKSTDK